MNCIAKNTQKKAVFMFK